MSELNLRELTRDVARTSVLVDLDSIAAETLKRIPRDRRDEALLIALRAFARQVVSETRLPGPANAPAASSKSSASRFVQDIREGWQRHLLDIYATETGNKRLRDFTHDDLIWQSNLLETQAQQKRAKARGWRKLAGHLEEYDVEQVGNLPAEVLMQTLGAVA